MARFSVLGLRFSETRLVGMETFRVLSITAETLRLDEVAAYTLFVATIPAPQKARERIARNKDDISFERCAHLYIYIYRIRVCLYYV